MHDSDFSDSDPEENANDYFCRVNSSQEEPKFKYGYLEEFLKEKSYIKGLDLPQIKALGLSSWHPIPMGSV